MYFVQWFPYSRVDSWVEVLAHILSVRWTTCQVSVRLFYSFLEFTFTFKTLHFRTSLVVQWFRLRLPMQGVQVWSLVWELGSYMPPGQKTKTWNRSTTVTNSIKALKNKNNNPWEPWCPHVWNGDNGRICLMALLSELKGALRTGPVCVCYCRCLCARVLCKRWVWNTQLGI